MDTAPGRELKNLLRRGEDALLRRDYERASTYFRRAYTADPGNIIAITNLGYTYAQMGRFSHAQKCFITALDIDPDNTTARKNLSLLMKPDKEGFRVKTSAARGKPAEELFLRYMEWGNLQMEQKNFYAAIQYFSEASKIHPDFIEPYLKIGISYENLREFASAVNAFSEALEIFPKDPVAREHLERCKNYSETSEYPYPGQAAIVPETGDEPSHTAPVKEMTVSTPSQHVPSPEPVKNLDKPAEKTAEKSPSSGTRPSDDDLIKSILNQYSDLVSDEKKPADEDKDPGKEKEEPESSLQSQEPSSITPQTPASSGPVSSDDIVSSILMQYQEDLAGTDEETGKAGPAPEEDTQVPHTGHAPLSGREEHMTQETKKGVHVELSDDQKDALRELGNIGASHAATTLSTMLNTPIMLNVPEIMITDFEQINQLISQDNSAMGIFTMEGQMAKAGYVILHVPRESVVLMTSIMLGMPTEPGRELNEMDESAITEIGNIMVSAFLDGTAELLGIIMLPSPPRTIFDVPKNVFDLIIKESNILYDNVVFFRTELICDEHELNLNIFMLPNPPVLQEIVRMLEKIIEDSAMGQ